MNGNMQFEYINLKFSPAYVLGAFSRVMWCIMGRVFSGVNHSVHEGLK